MNNADLPKRYIEKSIEKSRKRGFSRLSIPNMPEEMRDLSIEQRNDWIGWKIVPSTVTQEQLDGLENTIGLQFPPLYRSFLQSYHFYDLHEMHFYRHPIHTWQNALTFAYKSYAELIAIGLIPFGEESLMDAGAICFDTRYTNENGDCPIVFWDHEWVGTDKEINPMFSSCEAMFRCVYFMAQADIDFIYHDSDEDSNDELPMKQKLLTEFLSLDPEGAGGRARDYWTTWGVEPTA
jgi:hypothetical protein